MSVSLNHRIKRIGVDGIKKSVAIVINTSWNVYNFRMGLIKSLQRLGFKVVVIAPRDRYSELLKLEGVEYYDININNKGTNPLEDLRLVYDFYKLYKKVAPDVILQYTIKPNIYGSFAAKLSGIPVVSNISGLGTVFLNDNFSSKIAKVLYKVALKIPKKVFFQNSDDRELFLKLGLVEQNKTDILPGSGIDTQYYKPINKTLESSSSKDLAFLFIARLVKDKGLIEYVEAAKIIKKSYPNSKFAILGAFYHDNPSSVTEQEVKCWEEEKIIKYLGTSDDVKSVIADYDCIVLPSYREGLSRVLLEASSMAKPIITTNVPGCKDVVEDGKNGFLCEVKSVKSLVKAIENMIHLSYEKRIQMGIEGRNKVISKFDENLVIKKYMEAIYQINVNSSIKRQYKNHNNLFAKYFFYKPLNERVKV